MDKQLGRLIRARAGRGNGLKAKPNQTYTRRREMLVMTRGMNDRVATDTDFAKHVSDSVGRFARRDWGEMADEDIKANDWSIDNGARVLAGYGEGDDRVWIIREHDGSATTILFPSEY